MAVFRLKGGPNEMLAPYSLLGVQGKPAPSVIEFKLEEYLVTLGLRVA